MDRREFLGIGAAVVGGVCLQGCSGLSEQSKDKKKFKISLAQWSLHKRLFGMPGQEKMDNLDFAAATRGYGIEAVEYVNQFFKDKAKDKRYLGEMKKRAEDNGVRSLLIMCDGEGYLGNPNEAQRTQAVENHYKWVEAAKFLGCHSIRVNAHSEGSYEEQMRLAADGLGRLSEFAAGYGLNVIVENHGGLSSNGQWLSGVMQKVGMDNCGTLPDFGNFREYDRYKGVKELMPWAKGVSAKSHEFDEQGNEVRTDYFKMMEIVLAAGYHGYVGIEYEGKDLSEEEGILATKRLLERVRQQV